MAAPDDTDPAIARLIIEGYRKMTPARRLALAGEMSTAVHEFFLAGLRMRHPGADDDELKRRAAEVLLGPELAATAWAAAHRPPLR